MTMTEPTAKDARPSEVASAPRAEPSGRGVLFLVVGPSGVGKDALIDEMRRLRPDLDYPRRVITRPADAGGEAHVAADDDAFSRLEAEGRLALSWRAHDLAYGVPIAAATALAEGRSVLVNVSRGVVDEARRRLSPVRVLSVTASREALAARLAARGRESAASIMERLARADHRAPSGDDVSVIDNGGALADAAAAMAAAIDRAIGPVPEGALQDVDDVADAKDAASPSETVSRSGETGGAA